ncbi:MAG TPA: type II toxin-antitoxin system HicA family toxin [Saprospiraceae bacterium]|jgi:predicted RNA binding protein YcfA (HicA-like mRNA interferase family)
MKIPRDESAESLIKRLRSLGYIKTRQTGSHIRISRSLGDKTFHLTIPNHNPIRIGTLSDILKEAAHQLEISKEELVKQLFL